MFLFSEQLFCVVGSDCLSNSVGSIANLVALLYEQKVNCCVLLKWH